MIKRHLKKILSFRSNQDKNFDIFGNKIFIHLRIEINANCNRKCLFCPRTSEELRKNNVERMSTSTVLSIIDQSLEIGFSGSVGFNFYNEPTSDDRLFYFLDYVLEKGLKTMIVTNGDVLLSKNGEQMLKKLYDSGLDTIRISLYDGPQQIKDFKKLKDKLSLNDTQFMIRERFLGKNQSFGLTISNRAGSVNLKTDFFELKPLTEPLVRPCYYPFYKVLIDHDGTVLMCSNDWKKEKPLGNILTESLLKIWSSSEFIKVRKKLYKKDRCHKPCNVCDVDGTLNGKRSFERWEKYFLKNTDSLG